MKTFKKWFLIVLVSGLALSMIGFSLAYSLNYSKGSRSGVVMKLSEKGVLFKTYEGQLDKGGIHSNKAGEMTSSWSFSVDGGNEELIKKLENVSITGERVKLDYEEKFFQFSWRGDTKYFVVDVESLSEFNQRNGSTTTTNTQNETQTTQTQENTTTQKQEVEQEQQTTEPAETDSTSQKEEQTKSQENQ